MEFDFQKQPGRTLYSRNLVSDGVPLVSIITPYYNGAEYLEQTYRCVLNQTFPWFEWILVNDGSTKQEDVDFLLKLAATDPRIRVIHKENGGISTARNAGLREAKTDYILPLDCDDLIEPTYLEYCWWMLEHNPNAAWAYADSCGFQNVEYLWDKTFNPLLMKKENMLTAMSLFRKTALDKMGGYAEVAKHYNEDWYLYLRLLANGAFPAQAKGEYLTWYRRRDGGVLSTVRTRDAEKTFNAKLISDAAELVKSPAMPVIFPQKGFEYDAPRITNWEKSIYRKHEKIHLTLLTAWLELGGADRFNLSLLSGLNKDEFEVSILTTEESKNEWQQRFREVTPDIFNLPNFMERKDYAEFISYFIRSRETDVLLVTNSYHGYYLIPWLRQSFPDLIIVDYVHMEEWYWRAGGYARVSAAFGGILEKTYVCNGGTKRVLEKQFGRTPESVETLHIGVDEEFFCPEAVEPKSCYQELGIDSSRPIVLFACRMHPQKRPFMMLEIAKLVSKKVPDVAFAVIGDGKQFVALKQKTARMGLKDTVFFLGSKKDVRPYYRDAKVTLICSLKEGLSLTAYESCSMGVPVVSADVGGQSDLVDDAVGALIPCRQREDEIDDRAFDEQELQDYVAAIVRILKDPALWKKESETCRKRIEEAFTVNSMLRRFEEECHRLCGDKSLTEKRHRQSEALSSMNPMAGEFFTLEVQADIYEDKRAIPLLHAKNLSEGQKANLNKELKRHKRINFLRSVADFFMPVGNEGREKIKGFLRRHFPYFIP